MIRFSFIWMVIILSFSEIGKAQERYSATVMDEKTREVLVGAHVISLKHFDKSIVTDATGSFQINTSAQDTLVISFIGFNELSIEVSALQYLDTIFLSQASKKLQEIAVKASRLGAESFAYEKLSPIDIYKNPMSKADPLVAINTSVSSTTKDENAAVSFRGATPNQTGYFLNGVPLKNPIKYTQLTNTGTLSIFNTDFLDNVTVFPGNPPLEYGQATSGSIVLETAERFNDYWEHTASISLANLGYSLKGKLANNTYLGLYSNYQLEGPLKWLNPSSFQRIESFNSWDGGITISTHQKWGSLKFFQYVVSDQYVFRYNHPSYQSNLVQSAERSISTLKWIQDKGPFQYSAITGYSYNKNDFYFGNLDYTNQDEDPYGSLNLLYEQDGHLLKTGYSVWQQQNTFTGKIPEYDYALQPDHPHIAVSEENTITSHEWYGYYRKKWNKHALGGGIRTGYLQETNSPLWAYQIHYTNSLTKNIELLVGNGFYYSLRNGDNETITKAHQSAIDLSYTKKKWALRQSLYQVSFINQTPTWGSETSFSIFLGSALQLDQSFSLIYQDGKMDWFNRSTLQWTLGGVWSLNATYQAFSGAAYNTVQHAAFRPSLDVFEPSYANDINYYAPYQNMSMSISKLFSWGEHMSGVLFTNISNVWDQKNINSREYNPQYSDYQELYFTRRSIYIGIVLNFIHKPQ
jgi:hypothetical protein